MMSPTFQHLHDQILKRSLDRLMNQQARLAACCGLIHEVDRLNETLQSIGLHSHIVSHIDETDCSVCVTVVVRSIGVLTQALAQLNLSFEHEDVHKGAQYQTHTLKVATHQGYVFVAAMISNAQLAIAA